jgi:PleD family two-component response regulator
MYALVAHHDPWARLVLTDALIRAGFDVAEASNGTAALRKATQTRPDVVVLGAHLSELAPTEVQGALKADPHTRGIGVFVVGDQLQLPVAHSLLLTGAALGDSYVPPTTTRIRTEPVKRRHPATPGRRTPAPTTY